MGEETWSVYSNQAAVAPPNFDLDHLLDIALARSARAQDHMWFPQTDPTHMHYYLRRLLDTRVGTYYPRAAGNASVFALMGAIASLEPLKRMQE
jgi:hypothetical protein